MYDYKYNYLDQDYINNYRLAIVGLLCTASWVLLNIRQLKHKQLKQMLTN